MGFPNVQTHRYLFALPIWAKALCSRAKDLPHSKVLFSFLSFLLGVGRTPLLPSFTLTLPTTPRAGPPPEAPWPGSGRGAPKDLAELLQVVRRGTGLEGFSSACLKD